MDINLKGKVIDFTIHHYSPENKEDDCDDEEQLADNSNSRVEPNDKKQSSDNVIGESLYNIFMRHQIQD